MNHSYYFIFQNDQLLLLSEEKKDERLPTFSFIQKFQPALLRQLELGSWENKKYYCAELSTDFQATHNIITVPLRKALELLGLPMFSLAVRAYSVITWDNNHRYCGRCSQPTIRSHHSFERTCTSCQLHFYPRISPSVIVLIQKDKEVLMARSPHFSPGMYGLIAGFVEAGETLEEAVHREVMEEVGIQIKNLRYFDSQPWPFPDSLMIAFTADFAGGELSINPSEIEDAGWYHVNALPNYPTSRVSIARRLIEHFIKQHQP